MIIVRDCQARQMPALAFFQHFQQEHPMPTPSSLNNEIRDMLMDCGLFLALTPADFSAAAGYFSISNIEKGQAIFSEGDAGTFMCIIHSGTVSVQKLNGDGKQIE